MTDPDRQLDYAPPAPLLRRRSTRRVIILLSLLLVILSMWRFAPEALHRIQLHHWQEQAMNYSAPAGAVAFKTTSNGTKLVPAMTVTPWKSFYQYYMGAASAPDPVFCHERISPSGNRRLVVVFPGTFTPEFVSLFPIVYEPGSLFRLPSERNGLIGMGAADHVSKIYFGQIDPADASHFTIDFDRNGQRVTMDGYLKDNDVVSLEQRSDVSPPAPSSAGAIR